jgi:hypothetical protein
MLSAWLQAYILYMRNFAGETSKINTQAPASVQSAFNLMRWIDHRQTYLWVTSSVTRRVWPASRERLASSTTSPMCEQDRLWSDYLAGYVSETLKTPKSNW